jgi:hypothetical protein
MLIFGARAMNICNSCDLAELDSKPKSQNVTEDVSQCGRLLFGHPVRASVKPTRCAVYRSVAWLLRGTVSLISGNHLLDIRASHAVRSEAQVAPCLVAHFSDHCVHLRIGIIVSPLHFLHVCWSVL